MRVCDKCGKTSHDGSYHEEIARNYSTPNYITDTPIYFDFCSDCWAEYLKGKDALLINLAKGLDI